MSRKLDKFIGDNRNEFDDAVPSAKVWENLAAGLEEKKKKKAIRLPLFKWSIAAAVLITAGLTIFFVMENKKNIQPLATSDNHIDSATGSQNTASENTPEVNEFAKMVLLKQEELKALAPEQPELYKTFSTDISQLDSSYKSLKNQLGTTPNREVLIEAMVQNLQLQLNVLNQQLNIIHQIKQLKKGNHEKNNQVI